MSHKSDSLVTVKNQQFFVGKNEYRFTGYFISVEALRKILLQMDEKESRRDMNVLYTVGLVVIQDSHLLLVRKRNTSKFMLPGGKIDPGEQEIHCLEREIQEELQCQVQRETLRSLGEFTDIAANEPNTFVTMKLYKGQLIGKACPSQEIEEIRWLDIQEPKEILIAPLVLNHILPLAAHFLSSPEHSLN